MGKMVYVNSAVIKRNQFFFPMNKAGKMSDIYNLVIPFRISLYI